MQNLKIRVNSADESKEAQELFFELGGKWGIGGRKIKDTDEPYLYLENGLVLHGFSAETFNAEQHKEITLPELRAMVNPIKEWLNTKTFEYKQAACMFGRSDWIEIPEGAEAFGYTGMVHTFYKNEFISFFNENTNNQWEDRSETLIGRKEPVILWQREQDEPFLTPETTLNDQYAEIEQVRQVEIHGTVKAEPDLNFGAAQASGGVDATLAERQSTYGNFEDVAFVTENIMSILAQVRVNGLNDLPNTHRMALYMIASKMARIVNGDFNHLDSWHDIGGYSKLIEKLIKGE